MNSILHRLLINRKDEIFYKKTKITKHVNEYGFCHLRENRKSNY